PKPHSARAQAPIRLSLASRGGEGAQAPRKADVSLRAMDLLGGRRRGVRWDHRRCGDLVRAALAFTLQYDLDHAPDAISGQKIRHRDPVEHRTIVFQQLMRATGNALSPTASILFLSALLLMPAPTGRIGWPR